MLTCCKKLLAAAVLLCCASVAAFGQAAGADLRVVVVDPAEAAVTGSVVELRRGGELVGSVKTVQAQDAALPRVAPGQYELRVQAEGFAAQSLQGQIKPGANGGR